jgi:hypothetical protein
LVYYDPTIDITPDVLRLLNAGGVAAAPGGQPISR